MTAAVASTDTHTYYDIHTLWPAGLYEVIVCLAADGVV